MSLHTSLVQQESPEQPTNIARRAKLVGTTISRIFHLLAAGALCGGFQLLTAPEAETDGTFPLFSGFWTIDKSIAVGVVLFTGLLNLFVVYYPKLKLLDPDSHHRKGYFALVAVKFVLFILSVVLTYLSPTLTSLVWNYCILVVIFILATAMKTVRENGLANYEVTTPPPMW